MKVTDSIHIDAAPDMVWAVTQDVERWPEWTPTVTSVHLVGNRELGLGSIVRIKQPMQPEAEWLVTELRAGQRFAWATRRTGLQMVGTHDLTADGTGIRNMLSIEAKGPVVMMLGPLLRWATRRALAEENRGLKARCEQMSRAADGGKERRRLTNGAGIILALCAVGCATERDAGLDVGWGAARIDSVNSVMPALLREYSVPGVAMALFQGSEIQWASGYGVISHGGAPVSPRTVFQAASLGKPVFAQLVESLARERAWSLEDSLAGWAAPGSYPRELGSLTAEAILSHSSGLVYDPDRDRVRLDARHRGAWQYSGAGYALLQRAVEASEGAGLESLAQDRSFRPLGLNTMGFVRPSTAEHARGHGRDGASLREVEQREANAASSLHASATDYARFLIHASGLGSAAPRSWQQLTTPRVIVRDDLGLSWGLGWAEERAPSGDVVVFHWGSNPGFKSFALVDRGRDIGLVILTNGDNGLELVEHVVGIIDPNPHPLFRFYMLHPDD